MGDVREDLRCDSAAVWSKADRGAHWWSLAYNGGQLLALIASIASTFILAAKLDHIFGYPINITAVTAALSALAAAAIGLPKHADAERKWRANRHTRAEAKILCRYLADPTADIPAARDWLASIERQHETMLLGAGEGDPKRLPHKTPQR